MNIPQHELWKILLKALRLAFSKAAVVITDNKGNKGFK